MALDGIVICAMAQELKNTILGGRISKIAQPEPDELMLTIKKERQNYRLFLSAGAALPLVYLTQENQPGPMTAPNFCMLLRKHINGGRIVGIRQPGLERIIHLDIEHLNELGDLCQKTLTVEIMGKHSNIIFCKEDQTIIDSIKHVSLQVSSVREVLPGRMYFIPDTMKKTDPLQISPELFAKQILEKPVPLAKAIYSSFTGISPLIAEELCHRASLESARSANSFCSDEIRHLYRQFTFLMDDVKQGNFTPHIVMRGKEPIEFSVLPLTVYDDLERRSFPYVSAMLETFYAEKNAAARIRQRSADLRRIVQTALERAQKKYDLQQKQLKDTEKRDQYRVYGELLNTYGYTLEAGAKKLDAVNYYTGEEVSVPLDGTLSAQENAQRYFDKYTKQKRTYEALSSLIKDTREEILHLESIATSLTIASAESDLAQIKEELAQYGYIRRHFSGKRPKITSKPFHYLSHGYHIYVGKNNFQNEELTFKFASGSDWWFHVKGAPGSHVIVKTDNQLPPDAVFEDAARLAAYYSQNRSAQKTEIDYMQKKHVKKVAGAKPGFVIYHTNYSMVIDSDISQIRMLEK